MYVLYTCVAVENLLLDSARTVGEQEIQGLHAGPPPTRHIYSTVPVYHIRLAEFKSRNLLTIAY